MAERRWRRTLLLWGPRSPRLGARIALTLCITSKRKRRRVVPGFFSPSESVGGKEETGWEGEEAAARSTFPCTVQIRVSDLRSASAARNGKVHPGTGSVFRAGALPVLAARPRVSAERRRDGKRRLLGLTVTGNTPMSRLLEVSRSPTFLPKTNFEKF